MRLIPAATALWMAANAFAQDTQLDALRATLATLHSDAAEAAIENLGGTPELTVAKHQLRDWIETQLGSVKDVGEEQALAAHINETLKAVSVGDAADDQNLLGFLGDVRLSVEPGLLIITTAAGILCQYGESA